MNINYSEFTLYQPTLSLGGMMSFATGTGSLRNAFKVACAMAVVFLCTQVSSEAASRPNIILAMADDQGWRDVGYNPEPGKVAITPNLDKMAVEGIRFNRFYSSSSNCAPTRAAVLTGRQCHRSAVFNPGYALHPRELTIAEVLKNEGYTTAHFGKWHLGPVKASSPVNPNKHGFDYYLSHDNFFELNPTLSRNGADPEQFSGDGSEIIVDDALKFIDRVKDPEKPFLLVIWFGSPHKPHKALDRDKALYKEMPEAFQDYFGEITALDRAMGTLRAGLEARGIDKDTLLWYTSDNGSFKPMDKITGLRGHKGEMWEGGIRVPGLIVWPEKITAPFQTEFPASTSDIMPTIIDLLGIKQKTRKFDGISIAPLILGEEMKERTKGLPYWRASARGKDIVKSTGSYFTKEQLTGWWRTSESPITTEAKPKTDGFKGDIAWIEGNWKLHLTNKGYELYNLADDQGETNDVAKEHPELVDRLAKDLLEWQRDAERSLTGTDPLE